MSSSSAIAQSASDRSESKRSQQTAIRRAQRAVRAVTEDLRALDAVVSGIAQEQPEADSTFNGLAEVGEGLRCVRKDLLADAIETLEILSALSESELRLRFERRQSWLRAEVE